MDESILKILVCPICKTGLQHISRGIRCQQCGRIYPIKNSIPIMLPEEANIDEEENKK